MQEAGVSNPVRSARDVAEAPAPLAADWRPEGFSVQWELPKALDMWVWYAK